MALLALVPASALCQSKPAPLQLKLGAATTGAATPLPATRHAELRAPVAVAPMGKRAHVFHQTRPSLSQRALQSLLENADRETPAAGEAAGETFRFERQGSAARDISQGYKRMCATVSGKLWDEPNGKRVKFDIAGKPGVAVEIPLR